MSARRTGRVAAVTGGAKGIGAGIARRLEAEGAEVVVFDLEAVPWAAAVIVDTPGEPAVERACAGTLAWHGSDRHGAPVPGERRVRGDDDRRKPMRRPRRFEEEAALVASLASSKGSFGTSAAFDLSGGRAIG